jgi:hypothetical protein
MLIVVASVLAVALTAGASAAGTRHVVVVRGKGFTLTAWGDKTKKLCFLLKAGKSSSSQCAEKLVQLPGRVNFTEFLNAKKTASYIGGAAPKRVVTVVASFADGKTVTMKTKHSRTYRGPFRTKVKFWAGKHAGPAVLRSVVGKDSKGATVEEVVIPPQSPPPPLPPPPCCGPPRAALVACPLVYRPACE